MSEIQSEIILTEERRWGSGSIDLKEHTLPSLKAERVLADLKDVAYGARFLDYGCGEGKLIQTIKSQHPEFLFFGVDVQKPLGTPRFEFALVKKENCPLFAEKFDVISSLDVLEHVPDLEEALKRMQSMLVENGTLVLFVPMEGEPLSPFGFYRWLFGADVYLKTKSHVHAYRRATFLPLVRKYFEIEKISYSYHILGTLLDSTFFALTSLKSLARWFWSENSIYHREKKGKGLLNRLMEIANWFCYFESKILAKVPLFASGVHIKARKISQKPSSKVL